MPNFFNPDPEEESPWAEASRIEAEENASARKSKRSWRANAWRAGLVLVLGSAIIVGGGYFYYHKTPGPIVGLQYIFPDHQILLGDQFVLTVSFSNYSDAILKNTKISLYLPPGVSFIGQSEGQRVMEQAIGDIGPGSINQQNFNLIVTSGDSSVKHFVAKASYLTAASSNTFEYPAETDITIGQPAVGLNMDIPQNILSGEEFTITVHYINNAPHEFKNLVFKIDYPPVFQFKRANVTPDTGSNVWNLGNLPIGGSGSIAITGSVIGPEKSLYGFNGELSALFSGQTYAINSQSANIAISPSPLSVAVSLDGMDGSSAAHLGDQLNYTLVYANNSNIVMQNVTVNAKLSGGMFEFASLPPDIPFNSLTNTITWFAGYTPELMNVAPGRGGQLKFSIRVKNSFPIRLLSDKNYSLIVDAEIESPTLPANTSAPKTISVAKFTTKVAGKFDFTAVSLWRDAKWGILNKGVYPPRVNRATQYSIHWKIVNYATDLSNVAVSAHLAPGVRFTGVVKNNMNTSPSYEPLSGIVSWQIPSIPATKGVISPAAEGVFQVEATPAINQVGGNMPLVGETSLAATDVFTGENLQASANSVDTSIPDDASVSVDPRSVQP
jgi:uncharacterized repeat protein (TIGR01451 family)